MVDPKGDRLQRENFDPVYYYLKGIPRSSKVKVGVNETEDPPYCEATSRDFVDQVEERESKELARISQETVVEA